MRRGWADDLRKPTNKPTTTVKENLEKQSTRTVSTVNQEESEEDCVILDADPSNPAAAVGVGNAESDEVVVVAEKGQIACRDYPHARHLCVMFPFKTNPHENYCDLCHCYVCDTKAPCIYWGTGKSSNDHCHSTDKEEQWRNLRQFFKQVNVSSEQHRTTMSNEPFRHPVVNCSPLLEAELIQTFQGLGSDLYGSILGGGFDNVNENYYGYGVNDHYYDDNDYFSDSDDDDDNDAGVQRVSLTGTVKWFNSQNGYGFIIPDNGDDDLFVHHSSIESVGRQTLTEGEKVEFQVDIDNRGRKKAINVSCPGGSFVQGTSGPTTSNEPLVHRVGTCFTILGAHEPRETLGSLNSLHLDQPAVQAETLTGTVKWFNYQKGYGFIIPDNGSDDLFVHHSSIESEEPKILIEGETVKFQIDTDNYGRSKAINVSSFDQASSGTSVPGEQHGVDEPRNMLQTLNSDGSGAQGDGFTGIVKWFDSLKGYGFIIPDGGGQELFVHRSSIECAGYQSLAEGETVKFQIDSDDYGRKRAINVVSESG